MPQRRRPSFNCPHCGEPVPGGARFCKACGSDEDTGWATGADEAGAWSSEGYSSDDDFDYDDYLRREFPDDGQSPSPKDRAKKAILIIIVIAVCAAMALSLWH